MGYFQPTHPPICSENSFEVNNDFALLPGLQNPVYFLTPHLCLMLTARPVEILGFQSTLVQDKPRGSQSLMVKVGSSPLPTLTSGHSDRSPGCCGWRPVLPPLPTAQVPVYPGW